MEDNEPPESEYVKGFNEGYVMAEHAPELADKLIAVMGDTVRSIAFKFGRDQLVYEKEQALLPDWLRRDRTQEYDQRDHDDKALDHDDVDRD